MDRYRTRSLWLDLIDDPLTPRPSLGTDIQVDVAIVGAGFTGLWTALYLMLADPTLRIAIVERDIAGFGASGRNGGWASGLFATSFDTIAAASSPGQAMALHRAMFDAVDEIQRQCATLGIDCDFHKGGTTKMARTTLQMQRLQHEVAHEHSQGFTDDDVRWLNADEARTRINATNVLGAAYTPHCARIQPAKLARGLAPAVEKLGVAMYESSPVLALGNKRVTTAHGSVAADVVIRATEGYTPTLPGHKRDLAPIYSLMVATEPLSDEVWNSIGLDGRDTFSDGRHLIIYGQRTADNRLAFGGRGAPYHWGSAIEDAFERHAKTHAELPAILRELFPSLGTTKFTHAWGGPLAAPRDWWSSVGFNRSTGDAWAGGYLGDGVTTTNLAGRTLADLITGADTDRVTFPWVNHVSRKWEPEPLRWLGVNGMTALANGMDAHEARTGKPSGWRQKAFGLFGSDH